jgi:hypothetical protein
MTAPRRTLPLLLALLTGPSVAGCIIIEKPVPITPPDAKPTELPISGGLAADLPVGPGEKIPTHPTAKLAANPDPAPPAQTTSRRPDPDAYPQAPPSPEAVSVARSEPGPLPTLPGRHPGEPEGFPPFPPAAEPPVLAAVRAFAENHPDRGIDALRTLDKPNQEFVLEVLPVLVRGATLKLSSADPQDVAALVDQLQAAAARLESRAALRVDKILFCRHVGGFGRYDPWPEALPYPAGGLAELYVEIGHLVSEPTANGAGFVTRLASCLEIRDANGRLVEQTDPEDRRRTVPVARTERAVQSRSPLQDFHMVYRIPVPSQPGVYTVTVEIRSPGGSNRVVRSRPVEFRVAGP